MLSHFFLPACLFTGSSPCSPGVLQGSVMPSSFLTEAVPHWWLYLSVSARTLKFTSPTRLCPFTSGCCTDTQHSAGPQRKMSFPQITFLFKDTHFQVSLKKTQAQHPGVNFISPLALPLYTPRLPNCCCLEIPLTSDPSRPNARF